MPLAGGDRGTKPDKVEVFLQLVVEGIKRGGWSTYCPAQRSWDGLVGGQVAFQVHCGFHLLSRTSGWLPSSHLWSWTSGWPLGASDAEHV